MQWHVAAVLLQKITTDPFPFMFWPSATLLKGSIKM
jgi:hypothetical protein